MPLERERLRAALLKKGFAYRAGGNHDMYVLQVDGKAEAVHTLLSRGSAYKTLDDGLVSRICKQVRLTKKQLGQYVDCTIAEDAYLALLRAQGVIAAAKPEPEQEVPRRKRER